MNPFDLIALSSSALKERKLRAALTIAMVVIGAGLITALNGMTTGMLQYMVGQFSTLGANVIIVQPASSSFRMSEPVRMTLERLPNVKDAALFIQQTAKIQSGGKTKASIVVGIDQTKLTLIFPAIELDRGNFVPPHDSIGILLGNRIANPTDMSVPFAQYGQSVTIEYSYLEGQKMMTAKRSFRVEGILAYMGTSAMFIPVDMMASISLAAANSLFKRGGGYDGVFVIANSQDLVEGIMKQIRNIYGTSIQTLSAKSIIQIVQNVLSMFQLFMGSIAAVSLVVASVGILAGLYTSVMERTREIGVLKALGFKNWMILMLFLNEAVLIGAIGGAIGDAVGVVLGHGMAVLAGQVRGSFTQQIPAEQGPGAIGYIGPIFPLDAFATVWLFSVALSVFAGVYPAWRASRLDPVVALRKE